jgi:L-2-hydroxyglutarate oxidase LhgO
MDTVDCVIVGAGVVGLAVARALAQAGREVIILEAAEAIGTGISSRNSEVIHAGIYYPQNSLMARFCVAGKRALYTFCSEHGVPHRRCGKLIVATNEAEAGKLASIEARARANGVEDLRFLSPDEARALEPALACTGALLSPSTGIVDSHHLMLALLGDAEAAGASLARNAPLVGGRAEGEGIEIDIGGADPLTLSCRLIVNAAGLEAPLVARNIAGMPQDVVPTRYFARP